MGCHLPCFLSSSERATLRLPLSGMTKSFFLPLMNLRNAPEGRLRGHVFRRGEPNIVQNVAEGNVAVDGGGDHSSGDVVLVAGTLPFVLACFRVGDKFCLLNEVEVNGEGDTLAEIETGQQVDTFDIASRDMIEMGANEFAGIGVRLLLDGVIDKEDSIVGFNLSQMGFDDLPEVFFRQFL